MIKTIRKLICYGLGILAVALLLLSIPRTIRVPLKDGGSVSFNQPSLIMSIFGSTSTVKICPKTGPTNYVDLEQDWFDGPCMVLPSTNTNVFFCIYDHDVDWQLIRIDVSQPFQTIPAGPVSGHVFHSTCKIERVLKQDTNDWNFVAATLEKMPSKQYKDQSVGINLLVYRLRTSQSYLAASMRDFGDQGMYPGDFMTVNYNH
jgi:hypothetical protein